MLFFIFKLCFWKWFMNFKFTFRDCGKVIKMGMASVLMMGAMMANAGMVTVSNYPLLLLSNAVTAGDESAQVLLGAGDVGHHGELSPSAKKLIGDSDYVVWFGGLLEQNLVNSLATAPNAISLFDFNAFERLPMRRIDGLAQQGSFDVHIWLEPENAKAIVRALSVVHSYANPDKKSLYEQNAKNFEKRMDEAVAQVRSDNTTLPYWAYHDAFQYLERSANLAFAGALTPDHHLAPKVKQIIHLNKTRPNAHMCIASQGKVSEGIVKKLGDVNVVVRQEDMSDGEDFVNAWLSLVADIQNCIKAPLKS